MHAQLAVLACGVHYHLTKALGLGIPSEFLQGAQAEVPQTLTEWTEVHLNKTFSREAFSWLVPLQSGHTRVGVMCARNARGALQRFLDTVAPQWHEWGDLQIATKPIAQMPLRQSYAERVLVIGEAAGQVKATTGGGIYYGLLAARIAAETISLAFAKGCFGTRILQGYEQAWRSLLADELALGLSFRKLYSWIGDRQMDGILHYIARNELKDLIRHKANFDWHRELIVELASVYRLGGWGFARCLVSNIVYKAHQPARHCSVMLTSPSMPRSSRANIMISALASSCSPPRIRAVRCVACREATTLIVPLQHHCRGVEEQRILCGRLVQLGTSYDAGAGSGFSRSKILKKISAR